MADRRAQFGSRKVFIAISLRPHKYNCNSLIIRFMFSTHLFNLQFKTSVSAQSEPFRTFPIDNTLYFDLLTLPFTVTLYKPFVKFPKALLAKLPFEINGSYVKKTTQKFLIMDIFVKFTNKCKLLGKSHFGKSQFQNQHNNLY